MPFNIRAHKTVNLVGVTNYSADDDLNFAARFDCGVFEHITICVLMGSGNEAFTIAPTFHDAVTAGNVVSTPAVMSFLATNDATMMLQHLHVPGGGPFLDMNLVVANAAAGNVDLGVIAILTWPKDSREDLAAGDVITAAHTTFA